MSESLTVAGLAVEAVGVTVTGFGLYRTWVDFSVRPFPPAEFARRHIGRPLMVIVRRLLRRREHRKAGAELAAGVAATSGGAARLSWAALSPDPAIALDELDRRVRDALETAYAVRARLEVEVRDLTASIGYVRRDLEAAEKRLAEQDHEVATGGVTIGSIGLAIILIGIAVQVAGTVIR